MVGRTSWENALQSHTDRKGPDYLPTTTNGNIVESMRLVERNGQKWNWKRYQQISLMKKWWFTVIWGKLLSLALLPFPHLQNGLIIPTDFVRSKWTNNQNLKECTTVRIHIFTILRQQKESGWAHIANRCPSQDLNSDWRKSKAIILTLPEV